MRAFFICALPRSRTAWLANFLTHGIAHCYHEALLHCASINDLVPMFQRPQKLVVGNSDCANALFMPALQAQFPGSPIVVIDRPIEECADSLHAIGIDNDESLLLMYAAIKEIKARYRPLVIDYKDLGRDGCRAIWEHCIGEGFDEARWELLDELDIQIFPQRLKDCVKNSTTIRRLFGAEGA